MKVFSAVKKDYVEGKFILDGDIKAFETYDGEKLDIREVSPSLNYGDIARQRVSLDLQRAQINIAKDSLKVMRYNNWENKNKMIFEVATGLLNSYASYYGNNDSDSDSVIEEAEEFVNKFMEHISNQAKK